MVENRKKEAIKELVRKAEKLVHDLERPPSVRSVGGAVIAGVPGVAREAETSLFAETLTQAWKSPAADQAAQVIGDLLTYVRHSAQEIFGVAQNAYNNEEDDVPEGSDEANTTKWG